MKEKELLIPTQTEVIKNRDLGKIRGSLNRHQRVAFAAFIKNSYLQMLQNNNTEQRYFTVPIKQFREELGIQHFNIFGSDSYSIEKSIEELMSKILEWKYFKSNKQVAIEKSVILSSFKIDRETQTITYSLGSFLQDKILCYGNAYITQMPLISSFKGSYAIALFEQLEQRRSFNKWRIDLVELKELLGVQANEYPRIDNFKARAINPAIDEIESLTNYFNLKYTTEKKGKVISHFIFTWGIDSKTKEHNKQAKLFTTTEEEIAELKTKIFSINGYTLKLIEIAQTSDSDNYIARVETKEQERAIITLKQTIEDSIAMFREYVI